MRDAWRQKRVLTNHDVRIRHQQEEEEEARGRRRLFPFLFSSAPFLFLSSNSLLASFLHNFCFLLLLLTGSLISPKMSAMMFRFRSTSSAAEGEKEDEEDETNAFDAEPRPCG